ncbi:hypothetical protein CMI46_01960 [Candidatus Pacearchaeota archaeon]|nr:hypothetical protein [Candidatus Pacearchaeota archaeon]|tara:strand:- start:3219 stop:3407 length:189 start_codon:yes stop_codon:yes gene_type:complete
MKVRNSLRNMGRAFKMVMKYKPLSDAEWEMKMEEVYRDSIGPQYATPEEVDEQVRRALEGSF